MTDEYKGPERRSTEKFTQLIMGEINKLQNHVCTLTGRFDEISKGQDAILRDIGRSHEIQLSLIQKNSEQDVKIAEACNDASEARKCLEGHVSGHWAWLGAALAAIPIVGGIIAWVIDKWKGSLAGGLK